MTTPKMMIRDFWGNLEVLQEYERFCSCCGAKWRGDISKISDKSVKTNSKGIYVWAGKRVKPWSAVKTEGYVIDSKNGPLTISIRKEW